MRGAGGARATCEQPSAARTRADPPDRPPTAQPPRFAGIEQQITRLAEVESLQEEWALQAEAQDEVERLLRADAL